MSRLHSPGAPTESSRELEHARKQLKSKDDELKRTITELKVAQKSEQSQMKATADAENALKKAQKVIEKHEKSAAKAR